MRHALVFFFSKGGFVFFLLHSKVSNNFSLSINKFESNFGENNNNVNVSRH